MKRILSFIVMGIAMLQMANAQVVELTGEGVFGVNPSTLMISDPGTVDSVVVVAAARFHNGAVPADVEFSDANETYTVSFNEANPVITQPWVQAMIDDGTLTFGYYTAKFDDADAAGIALDNFGQEEYVRSFTAYIYRSGGSPEIHSEVKGEHAFLFIGGSDHPLVYNFTIPTSSDVRDVIVTLPFTDLESEDLRYANVSVTAGAQTVESEFDTNNAGDLLHLETITVPNVPGDVTEVTVSLYSQFGPSVAGGYDEKDGDSFVTGPALLTTISEEDEEEGCTLTQGYWKTHSEYGPAKKADPTWDIIGPDTEFFWSGMSYIEVLNTSVSGNAYYILAHQYIAAELNFLAGADNSEVVDEFDEATVLFNTYTPSEIGSLGGSDATRKMFVELAEVLDDYNNGEIGPGHCDGDEWEGEMEEEMAMAFAVTMEASVSPNPVKNRAKVRFVPVVDGNATVELYDSMGNLKEILFDQNVSAEGKVQLTLNASQYNEGSYILVITNGAVRTSIKLGIDH
jgi:hypothetical protein